MKNYLLTLSGCTIVLLLSAAAMNVLINPYDVFPIPRIEGVSLKKPAFHRQQMHGKMQQYLRVAPKVLLLGNSRVAVGFDTQSPAWPSGLRPVYNMGLPGVGLQAAGGLAAQVIRSHAPKQLYIGLDFVDFLVSEEDWRQTVPSGAIDFAPITPSLQDLRHLVFSMSALNDGVSTILAQSDSYAADTDEAGWVGEGDYRRLVATEGHHALFHQALKSTLPRYARRGDKVRWPGAGSNPELAALERLVTIAQAEGVEVVLFTYPYHAWMLTGLHDLGLFPALADWKAMLAEWAADRDIPLWDFTHFSPMTEEAVSAPGDRQTKMRWYWEGGHFKAALGAAMVSRMLTNAVDHDLVSVRLTPAEAELARSRLDRGDAAFRMTNQQAITIIGEAIKAAATATQAAKTL